MDGVKEGKGVEDVVKGVKGVFSLSHKDGLEQALFNTEGLVKGLMRVVGNEGRE